MPKMTSWYEILKDSMQEDGEDFGKRYGTMSEDGLREVFYIGDGCIKGRPFTAWGVKWVYFPIQYDGEECIGHAPRDPCDIAMKHQGYC